MRTGIKIATKKSRDAYATGLIALLVVATWRHASASRPIARSNGSRITTTRATQIRTGIKIPTRKNSIAYPTRLIARRNGWRIATNKATQIRTGIKMPAKKNNPTYATRLICLASPL